MTSMLLNVNVSTCLTQIWRTWWERSTSSSSASQSPPWSTLATSSRLLPLTSSVVSTCVLQNFDPIAIIFLSLFNLFSDPQVALWGAIKSSPLGLSHISRTYFRLLCFTFIARRCYCFQNDCFLFFAQIICLQFYPVLPQNMIVDVAGKLVFPPWPLVSRRYDRTYATPPPIKISLCGKTSSFRMNKYLITVLCCKKLIVSDE